MRCLSLLTLGLFLFLPFPAKAKDIVAESIITEATVYTNRATVTRRAEVDIAPGDHTVIIKQLPAQTLSDSLRVEGEATGGNVVIGALSHKLVSRAELVAERERELNEQIEKLQDQQAMVIADQQALLTQKNFLETLGQQAKLREDEEIAKLNLNTDQWGNAADTLYTAMSKNLRAAQTLDIKLRDITEDIDALQRELNQIRTGQKSFYEVSIPLEADAQSSLVIELSYQLYGASWKPIYDARLDTKTAVLELIQYGAVRQTTGEDWNDVQLTLSTAQPHRGAGLPDLRPNWLDLFDPKAQNRGRKAITGSADMSVIGAPAATMMAREEMSDIAYDAPQTTKARMEQAQIETGGFVSEYKIAGPSTVNADGTESKLLIGTHDTKNRLEVQVKPQLSNDAFLVSHATLQGEAPVLPGQVNIFRDGSYIGQSYLPLLRPNDEQQLAFGIDDNIEVERNILKDERSEAGVISKDHVLERVFLTRVKNLHNKPMDIAVLETIPVARDKKINVEILSESTTPGYGENTDDINGLLKWSYTAGPSEEKKIGLGWRVSWPKDQNLRGL